MQEFNLSNTVESIKEAFNAGQELQFIFFWGHTETKGRIKKQCLSQWYPCSFEEEGVHYYTTEQYMMAQKALLFKDQEIYQKIMQADNPKAYKKFGRIVHNFDKEIWDKHKKQIVYQGNMLKFSQNPELKEFLINTGDAVLVEASPYDDIWGVKLAADDKAILDPNNWQGENLLGFSLMEVRKQLKNQ